MAYDDERGRTGNFSTTLVTPPGGGTYPGPRPNSYPMVPPPNPPQFLGGEAGGFLQGGGNGGGFTNFSQYLLANQGGAGQPDSTPRTPGQAGLDTAMNNAYGVHVDGDPNAGTGASQQPPDATPAPAQTPWSPPTYTPPQSPGTGGRPVPADDNGRRIYPR